jgi:hypothetical protein
MVTVTSRRAELQGALNADQSSGSARRGRDRQVRNFRQHRPLCSGGLGSRQALAFRDPQFALRPQPVLLGKAAVVGSEEG